MGGCRRLRLQVPEPIFRAQRREEGTWPLSIGRSVRRWKASPARQAELGYSKARACRFPSCLRISRRGPRSTKSAIGFHLTRDQIVDVLEFAARSLDRPLMQQHETATGHARPV